MGAPLGFPSGAGESRGVANVVGYVIIITLVLASVTIVVGLGSTAIGDTMDRSEQNLAEHTMTLFDSRAAMVALGTSDSQTLSFNQDSGLVETRPTAGQITIEHLDYDGSTDETLFDESLGAMVYVNGDTEIAYQGGGVWRRTDDSDARMLSPPEFYYRGSTLTLPVIRVTGDSESATSPRTTIRSAGETTRIFPSERTYAANERTYENPLEEGRVRITVQSSYYQGWAAYARQRTNADVTTFDGNETVRFTLKSLAGSPGQFGVPLEGDSLEINGLGSGHPITDFTLTLKPDGNFQNAHWSLYSNEDGDEFEMHIHSPSQCKEDDSYDGTIDFSLYYFNDSTGAVREWQNPSIPVGENSAFDVSCADEELTVDFTNDNTDLTYQEISMSGSNNKWCFGEHIDGETPDGATLTSHDVHSTETLYRGTTTHTVNFVVNHYMSRMGTNYELTVTDGAGNSECLSGGQGQGSSNVDESASSGNLDFTETDNPQFLTYLHVTENWVGIDLN